MRLFLLPISARRTLIYCDKHLARQVPKRLPAPSSPGATKTEAAAASTTASADKPVSDHGSTPVSSTQQSFNPQALADRITTKAADTWSDWERAPGGWKKKLTVYGNSLLRRIPYQEWGLKSIPPLTQKRRSEALEKLKGNPVKVLFPPSFLKEADVLATLQTLATERQELHRKRMWACLIGAPLTLPFALVPVVPNIPGFYLLFRAWSHYRALYGARHLEYLVEHQLVKPAPNQQLDDLYTQTASKASKLAPQGAVADAVKEKLLGTKKEDVLLLDADSGSLISKSFGVSEMCVEIERAVEQVEQIVEETAKEEANKTKS